MFTWAIRKALSPFGKVKPIKWIRSHGLLKHDITRAKGHDIIRSGLQVTQLITAGYLMRKQSNSAFKVRQIRKNILRTFWLF